METTISSRVKSLGQVLTPPTIAEFMARWAIKTPKDKILEPSCGDGVFLKASIQELLSLGAQPDDIPHQVYGIELDRDMIEETRRRLLSEFGVVPTLINSNFFDIQLPSLHT
ncbi:N-6 DNA methylase [Thermococcus sp.]|uniref:N-6 DNA methylase n=1 Tax=Thermococcus sp. TaxID=35749 RepID=UPI00260B1A92|nr:N-6 DNA methylase [Thermococcus sp.]